MVVTWHFGGFYESVHSEIIKDYKLSKEVYSKLYIDYINHMCNINMKYLNLDSPVSYNYETDVIIVEINKEDADSFIEQVLDSDADDFLKEDTESRDGFTSFYTYEDLFKEENKDVLVSKLSKYISDDLDVNELVEYIGDRI